LDDRRGYLMDFNEIWEMIIRGIMILSAGAMSLSLILLIGYLCKLLDSLFGIRNTNP
jgi:hypothetical protein